MAKLFASQKVINGPWAFINSSDADCDANWGAVTANNAGVLVDGTTVIAAELYSNATLNGGSNGVATNTGTTQTWLSTTAMRGPIAPLLPFISGLTAHAGGGQTSAVPLIASINRVNTVATGADSVLLPPAQPGTVVTVINAAASNAMAVFPSVGDLINALSANASLSVAANKTITFFCATPGKWNSQLTA